jgi:hypothetical protein
MDAGIAARANSCDQAARNDSPTDLLGVETIHCIGAASGLSRNVESGQPRSSPAT